MKSIEDLHNELKEIQTRFEDRRGLGEETRLLNIEQAISKLLTFMVGELTPKS